MDTINAIDRTGSGLPCAPATVVSHEVAHAAIPAARLRRRWAEPLLVAAATPRTRGEVSPASGGTQAPAIAGPIFDEHKCTGASVPGRRGGT